MHVEQAATLNNLMLTPHKAISVSTGLLLMPNAQSILARLVTCTAALLSLKNLPKLYCPISSLTYEAPLGRE